MNKLGLLVIDLMLVLVSTAAAIILRENLQFGDLQLSPVAPYLIFSLLAATLTFATLGVSRAVWRLSNLAEYLKLLLATVVIVVAAVAMTFSYNRLDGVPRSLPILQGLVLMVALVGARVLMRLRHIWRDRRVGVAGSFAALTSSGPATVLVVGLGPLTDLYVRAAAEFGPNRVRIAGLLGRNDRQVGRSASGLPVLGTPEEIDHVLRDLDVHGVQIDQIIVVVARAQLSHEAQTALELATEATRRRSVVYFEDLIGLGEATDSSPPVATDDTTAGPQAPRLSAVPAASDQPTSASNGAQKLVDNGVAAGLERRLRAPYWRWKRLMDGAAALVLLGLLSPVFIAVSIVALFDIGAPVTFWQLRPGRFGRSIKLYKFRTMRPAYDRDRRKRADVERVSAIGHFLRRTRLDELPQLWNILIGEMSFVGPRPLLPVDQSPESNVRLLIRPGLTGWAQVKGGRDVEPMDKAALDISYMLEASLARDFEILRLTIPMVVNGERIDQAAIRSAWSVLAAHGIRLGEVDRDRPASQSAGSPAVEKLQPPQLRSRVA